MSQAIPSATVSDAELAKQLNRLVGTWATEATHPARPGVIVQGAVDVEWLEGQRFLIHHAGTDNPEFPDSISIIGSMSRAHADAPQASTSAANDLCMHYYDSRGVFRIYDVSIDGDVWRMWRDAPGFSQRFAGRFTDRGETIEGQWELREGAEWTDDLQITYRRRR